MNCNWQVSRGKLFGILFAGLFVFAVGIHFALFRQMESDYRKSLIESLQSAATCATAVVDPAAHQALKSPTQESTAAYKKQIEKLQGILEAFPTVQRFSTLLPKSDRMVLVLRATKGKTTSNNTLLTPIEATPPEVPRVMNDGMIATSSEPVEDSTGLWNCVYAPILGSNGKPFAVLRADMPAGQLTLPPQDLRIFAVSAVAALVVCWGVAALVAFALGPPKETDLTKHRSNIGRIMGEVILLASVVFLIVDSGFSLSNHFDILQDRVAQSTRLSQIVKVSNFAPNASDAQRNQLAKDSQAVGLSKLAVELKDESSSNKLKETLDQSMADALKQSIALDKETKANQDAQTRVAIIAALVALISLLVVRYASAKEAEFLDVRETNLATQHQYQNVVENLPVGLFTFKDGTCTFGNKEWKSQISNPEPEDLTNEWLEAIHPADRPKTLRALQYAEESLRPFDVVYRIVDKQGNTRYLEARGTPVLGPDGQFSHLLGFSIDVTAMVATRNSLQEAYQVVETRNTQLNSALAELEQNLSSMVRSFVRAVEAKDPYTAGHSERVMQYSLWLGEAIGLGPYELRILELGTLVHDVGKIGIPDAILTKPGRLTEEEFEIVKMHPVWGEEIISHIGLFEECRPIVRSHHERLNGTGYPDGKTAGDISILVRISSIADIFDAMTSTRAYRKGMAVDTVLSHMAELTEKGEIDPHLFSVFANIVREKGVIPQAIDQLDDKVA